MPNFNFAELMSSKKQRSVLMKFNGINHLAMATGDMDATIRFWRDLLGMRLVGGLGEPGL